MDVQLEALRATIRRAERDGATRLADVEDLRNNMSALPQQHRPFLARQLAARMACIESDIVVLEQLRAEYRRGGLDSASVSALVETLGCLSDDLQSCQRELLAPAARPESIPA